MHTHTHSQMHTRRFSQGFAGTQLKASQEGLRCILGLPTLKSGYASPSLSSIPQHTHPPLLTGKTGQSPLALEPEGSFSQ